MTPPPDDASHRHPEWLRMLLAAAGTLSLALGIIGMLLPVMPTTPFLLLAAACYLRSSKKLYDWMHTNRLFGSYMRGYRDGNGIPLSLKIATLSILWTTMLVSGLVFVPDRLWWVRIILFASGASVTVHVLRLKTAKGDAGKTSGREKANLQDRIDRNKN